MIPAINSFRTERRKPSFGLIYCSVYRRHFKVPLILSAIAIAINFPAFFEIQARLCYRMPEGRLGYGVGYYQHYCIQNPILVAHK